MEDSSETALIDQLFGQSDGRGATVIIPDHVGHTPFVGKSLDLDLITATNRLQYWFIPQVEKVSDLAKRVGVGAAHETVTDESDIEFLHDIGCCDWQWNGAGQR